MQWRYNETTHIFETSITSGASWTVPTLEASVINSGTLDIARLPTITAVKGGTGQTSYAVGDLLYASTTTALSKLAAVAAGSYLRSAGTSTAPVWSTLILPNAATVNQVVYATSTNTYGGSANLTFDGTTVVLTGKATITNASGDTLVLAKTGNGPSIKFTGSASNDMYIGFTQADDVWKLTKTNASTAIISATQAGVVTIPGSLVVTGNVTAALFKSTTAVIAVGAGSTAIIGKLAATGPATAAQNGWMNFVDSTGANVWVPTWK